MNMRNVEWEKEAKVKKKLKTSALIQDSVNKPYFKNAFSRKLQERHSSLCHSNSPEIMSADRRVVRQFISERTWAHNYGINT